MGGAIVKDPFQEAVRARLETVSSSDGHLTVPVDPEKIAEQLDLEVVLTPLESNVGGFVLKKNGEAVKIYVNSNDSWERRKFTLAHEIGHYWLHRDDDGEFGYVIFSFWFDHAVPSNVMVAWMASTFVEVIGILWVITRSLFPFNDAYRDRDGEKSKTKDC